MFSWICPKCGHEVPPAYAECPNCASAEEEAAPAAEEAPAGEEAAATAEQAPAAPPPVPPPPVAFSSLVVPAPVAPPAPASSRVAVPGWLLSVMFALVFIVIGLTVIVVRQVRQPAPAPVPSKAAQIESVEAIPTAQSDPEFKDLELIGFRLTEDEKQKAFVQFVVVNHSGADLGQIGAKAELMTVTARDKQAVGTFEFKVSLGPYESKDVRAPLETKLRVYELPDWQFLRAEITGH